MPKIQFFKLSLILKCFNQKEINVAAIHSYICESSQKDNFNFYSGFYNNKFKKNICPILWKTVIFQQSWAIFYFWDQKFSFEF